VKTAHGWKPCNEPGRTLAAIRARAAHVTTLTDTQLIVLRTLDYPIPFDDRTIATRAGLDKGSAGKRRQELVAGGLVEQAVPRSGRAGAKWRLTADGVAALGTSIFTALPRLHLGKARAQLVGREFGLDVFPDGRIDLVHDDGPEVTLGIQTFRPAACRAGQQPRRGQRDRSAARSR
jgi:hypothetical protein